MTRYQFEGYSLDLQSYELRHQGQLIKMRHKVFNVLAYLIEQRDRVVSKAELLEHLWPEQFVTDTTLTSCIMEVRQALEDRGRGHRIIQTLHGRGYRFVASLEIQSDDATDNGAQPTPPSSPDEAGPGNFTGSPVTFVSSPTLSAVSMPPLSALHQSAPGTGVSEYKPVTVLVGLLVDTTERAQDLAPEALHSLRQVFFAVALETVQEYGGTVQQMHEGLVRALFGVPTVYEDHARRAVLAAVAFRQRLHECHASSALPAGDALAVCLGVHTGQVVVGPLGTAPHLTITAVGDTLEVADQLQRLALPGMILLSETTMQLVQGEVTAEAFTLPPGPGSASVSHAYHVRSLHPQTTYRSRHSAQALSPFVGRTPELAALQTRWAQVTAGRGQVVGMVGEPGMGKSRLLDEFRQSIASTDGMYLEGRCLPHGHDTPYLPLLAILRQACDITEVDSAEVARAKGVQRLQDLDMAPDVWAPCLLHLLGLSEAADQYSTFRPPAMQDRIVEFLWQLSARSSRQRPVILVIEDMQWVDAALDACLVTLAQRLAGMPLLLLVTYRPGYRPAWLDKSYAVQLALMPLDTQASRTVLQSVLATVEVADSLMQRLLHTADGNPFFLQELARVVVERGTSVPGLEVPATLQAVLQARIDRLSSKAKRLVQIAAAIGEEGPLPLLQTVAALPSETFQECLGHLQATELLYAMPRVPESRYAFKHALTHEVAYRAVLTRTRQQFHRQIAQCLVEQFPVLVATQPEMVAHHYTEGGLGALAVPYWQRAGQRALARSAPVAALTHVQRGLALLATLPDTAARRQQALILHLARAVALTATQGYAAPAVQEAYLQARAYCEHAGDTVQLCMVLHGLWLVNLVRGEIHTAITQGDDFLRLAQQYRDPALLLEAYRMAGTSHFFLGDLDSAWTHLAAGIALYEAQQHSALLARYGQDPGLVCLVYGAWLLWLRGYADQALAHLHTALTLAQQCQHPWCMAFAHTFAVLLHQCRRDLAAMSTSLEVCLPLAQQQGFPLLAAMGLIFRGWVQAESGHGAEGIAHIHQGLAAYRATGAELSRPYFLGLLAQAYWRHGQIDTALETLDEALVLVDTTGEQVYGAELYWLKGEMLCQVAGQALAPETCFLQALEVSRRQRAKAWELRAALSLSRLWQRHGKRAAAHTLLTGVSGWFTEGPDVPELREARALLEALQ